MLSFCIFAEEAAINPRLRALCTRLAEQGMDGALLIHPRDILYYAGTVRPAVLLISCPYHTAEEPQVVLFVRRGLEYARKEATVPRVEPMSGFSSVAKVAMELELLEGVIGTEMDLLPARLYLRLDKVFPGWSLADVSPLILAQRMVKDEEEIAVSRQAGVVADAGQEAARRAIAAGISELELAAEVEAAIRRAGHEGFQPLRDPGARGGGVLLMSGEHLTVRGGHGLVVTGAGLSPAMPYGPSQRLLSPGDLVVVDIGSTWQGYTADESRTFVVGQASAEQRALFAVAYAVEEAVCQTLRPGLPVAEVYRVAEAVVAQGAPPFFAPGSLILPGFVGHGVGLEVDEPPVLWTRDETVLAEGMVLAVEVEVSAPERGMMVKLEDTVVVHSEGCEWLTHAPRELVEC
ncbi:MAG: Xaa-Pro peptidase family protein [Anaerolineae bacterium]|nr:Xaa-Pro peptidase family protein [Anaerolineae bacterium]